MRSSFLVGAVLLLAVLVAALTWGLAGRQGEVHATGPAAREEARPAPRLDPDLAPIRATRTESTERSSVDAASVVQEEGPRRSAAVADGGTGDVLVRVSVVMADGSERNFAGFEVEAQSWNTDTDAVELHSAELEVGNLAEFRFEGPIHLDFVRFIPPRDLGFAFGYVEDHIDLDPGDEYTPVLEITPGAALSGRVVDDFGLPVQGVRVHAYADDNWSDLSDWDPGLTLASTGTDGRFQLPLLPEGSWGLSVEPDGWLQIMPSLDEPIGEVTWFDLEAGDDVEGGDIVITSLHRFDVQVVDAAGIPAPGAYVELEPVSFRSPKLATALAEPPDELQQFLSGADEPAPESDLLAWPYDNLGWTTDSKGRAKLLGVTGSWNLRVRAPLTQSGDGGDEVRVPLELPAADQVVRMGETLWTFKGRTVDEKGKPISGVTLRLSNKQNGQSQTTRSEAEDGSFSFEALPPRGDLSLLTIHSKYVDREYAVPFAPAGEPRDFPLREAGQIRMKLLDPSGEVLSRQRFKLLSGVPSVTLAPSEAELFERSLLRSTQRISSRRGLATFTRLPPGRYEVGLMLAMPSEQPLPNGQLRLEMRPYQTWQLETGPELHELVIDMSGYVPPAPPPRTIHLGVVRDATTGEGVARALLRFAGENGTDWARANGEGAFNNRLAPGSYTLSVLAEGYEPLVVPMQTYGVGEVRHDLSLQPGGRTASLVFVDSAGRSLPSLHARFLDAEGRPVTALVRFADGEERWRDQATAPRGRLEFANVPAGELVLQLSLAGVQIASPSILVPAGGVAGELRLPLEASLDDLRDLVREASDESDH